MRSLSQGFVPVEVVAPKALFGDIQIKSTRGHQRVVVAWQSAKATWVYLLTKPVASKPHSQSLLRCARGFIQRVSYP